MFSLTHLTKLDLGGTPKNTTCFTVILKNKICAGVSKQFHSKAWWWFVRWPDRAAAEKSGINYPIHTLTSYALKLEKGKISSLTINQLQNKDAGQFETRLTVAKQSACTRRVFINWSDLPVSMQS